MPVATYVDVHTRLIPIAAYKPGWLKLQALSLLRDPASAIPPLQGARRTREDTESRIDLLEPGYADSVDHEINSRPV